MRCPDRSGGRIAQRRRARALAPVALGCALLVALASLLGGWAALSAGAVSAASLGQRAQATLTPTPVATPLLDGSAGATPPPTLAAKSAYLLDQESGKVYFARHAGDETAMASTTKIMTAVTALAFASLDQRITVTAEATALDNGEASVAGLRKGETFNLRELLYALMLPSGDDAAVAIAIGVAGSQQHFIALMNDEASLLGLWRTHYSDVHGLDAAEHYTTARDLTLLARAAMRVPTFAQVVATPQYTLPATAGHSAYVWQTTNKLLTTIPYSGATGVKTGFTGAAGACLVFSATRNGRRLLGVVLGEPSVPTEDGRFTDAAALLNWGFAQPA